MFIIWKRTPVFSYKVEIFLELREVAFLSPRKICENLNFSTVHPEKFKFSQILMGGKNANYPCSKIISTLPCYYGLHTGCIGF